MPKPLDRFSDEELAVMASSGDHDAMDYLLRKYTGLVRAVAHGFFLSGGDSDDVIQEGMIGLFKAVRDFKADKNVSFAAFSKLCIKRQILSAVKIASRKKNSPLNSAVSLSEPAEIPAQMQLSGNNPELMLIRREEHEDLVRVMDANLSVFEQKVLLHYLQGSTYREIGLLMDKPPKSIDNAIQRIKRKLAPYLKDNH